MKLATLFSYVDEIKPNSFREETKTVWLNEVEGLVQTEVMLVRLEEVITYDYSADAEKELLVVPPHSKIYAAYLIAQIDFANGEYNKYQNSMVLFNSYFGEYQRWFADVYRPADTHPDCDENERPGNIGMPWRGYYLSAYGLAVKHGFVGTEADWIASLEGAPGVDGRSAELRYNEETDNMQWRLQGDSDWIDLMALDVMRAPVIEETLQRAETAQAAAQQSADAAQQAELNAQTSATAAEKAQQAAEKAQQAAESAEDTANTKASEAAESAQSAAGSASTATAGANTATTKASEASTSAENAAQSENNASASENAAAASATAAENAQAAAEKARDEAQVIVGGDFATRDEAQGMADEAEAAANEYTDQKIAAIPTPDVSGQIGEHNTDTQAHSDIRLLLEDLSSRLNALADSDDTTLDQMSEIVEYIKSNKSLINSITTSKVNVRDIIDNLTTNVSNKPLSAAQGVILKSLVDAAANSAASAADAAAAAETNANEYTDQKIADIPDPAAYIVSESEPSVADNPGKYWINTANGNAMYFNTGSAWALVPAVWA